MAGADEADRPAGKGKVFGISVFGNIVLSREYLVLLNSIIL